jgi:hypothetical protein
MEKCPKTTLFGHAIVALRKARKHWTFESHFLRGFWTYPLYFTFALFLFCKCCFIADKKAAGSNEVERKLKQFFVNNQYKRVSKKSLPNLP